ncbi:Alpha/Beta hydrolase protein [Dimargaris cristalligena]|uniref:Alpha/Beta hydrolase protein n=1 Tax=Dimargaris cristalligena TaxID=215637 RepID=A0A4P9ZPQ2_9FUNG|nr:Alpha/Beta hydrolase protein [Dimargaris cristalligena]|eukprot:RKP35333.1 Alpha/Beta hydrolase protein [Dimargaris cristalligena]
MRAALIWYNDGATCDLTKFAKEWAKREDVPAKEVEHYKLLRNYAFAAYQSLSTMAEEVEKDHFIKTDSVNIFESLSTAACHGFVAEDSTGENIYVSFRGSTPEAKVTFFYDAMGWSTAWPGYEYISVHKGFLSVYSQCIESYTAALDKAMANSKAKTIYFLGHSLGGAVANLAAFDYASVYKGKKTLPPRLVTFGSPPVGNREFVKQYNSRLIPSTLVTSGFDLVPNVHLMGTYFHVKKEIYILPGGKRTIQCIYDDVLFANDPNCSPDLSMMNCSIADHSNYWGLIDFTPTILKISESSDPRLKGTLVKQPTDAQLEVLESIGNVVELNDKTLESVVGVPEESSDIEYYVTS